MDGILVKTKKSGSSIVGVLPNKLGIAAGEEIFLKIRRLTAVTKAGELFGKLKTGGNTAKALKQVDKELWLE